MGSEVDAEAAGNTSAVDSDGSVSWEDFFGTSTDLVPQLLGMFDELARRGGNGYKDCHHHSHVVLPSSCGIPAALQKRLSLVQHSQHRGSIFGQLCTVNQEKSGNRHYHSHQEVTMSEEIPSQTCEKHESSPEEANIKRSRSSYGSLNDNAERRECSKAENADEKPNYRRESSGLTPLRYSRRCRSSGRPLSGSSIASSTSSSGCSNQGSPGAANLYLASVESLADTCASSQGSGDSGVITISEASCRIANSTSGPRRDSTEGDSPGNRPRYCDPHRNPVERVLLEIVDTEAIYVEHLRQVIQGYLIYWRDHPTSFVHQLQLSDLFSNIEDIFEFNREFLKEIEKCSLDPICVANTFIKHNSGFKVYTEYCTNYPRTVSVLTNLMGQEETATAFRERQAALGHALPLGSFLLKPVQRILKYHLLLENLSKEHEAECDAREKEADGRGAIEAALAAMTGIAKHINAMKRRHEHAVRVQEIQSLLYGWSGPDLTTSGELVAEGRFRIRGAKAPRHAFLFDRMLLLTKKKEDGLLVYKAHIMCANLMLIESIPGDPLSFHVIPFDNPRLQYTLQARNLEQKREWTLQIKRVILENYNAVIPSHARQLVLQLGQTHSEDDTVADKGSTKKQHSAPPEYLERRKQERERRRSETGLRQKFKKNSRKLETNCTASDANDSSVSPQKSHGEDFSTENSKEQPSPSRVSDGRPFKVKDRFAGWRRKSEPGFQSYVCLNQSDDELQKVFPNDREPGPLKIECVADQTNNESSPILNLAAPEAKGNNDHVQQTHTVEEIVGHILMQNQEFQKLLEKQRTNSIINVRQQQRFNKHRASDTSDESDSENTNYPGEPNNSTSNNNSNMNSNNQNSGNSSSGNSSSNNKDRVRFLREQQLLRTNNTWNTLSSSGNRENQPSLQLLYDNLKRGKPVESTGKNRVNRVHEKKALFEAFKRQSIVTESKIIKTALRIRENSNVQVDDSVENFSPTSKCDKQTKEINSVSTDEPAGEESSDRSKSFGNYDNLQHVWEGLQDQKDVDSNDSPVRPAVWLTKLCEGLPLSPQKCGSLPRSFQINPNSQQQVNVTKPRFLQRDGRPMSERPFTIASDKPAEINLEDIERYASTCQPEGRIAKFPTSSPSSNFFYSLDDALTDAYSEIHISTSTNIHPDHKVYRGNRSASNSSSPGTLKNVLLKAGCRLQVLRNTASTETLECTEELERAKHFSSLGNSKLRRKSKTKRESSSDVEELLGCVAAGTDSKVPSLYYKQGSSGLGARIAQFDYADPAVLFSERKLAQFSDLESKIPQSIQNQPLSQESRECETDGFYEKSFETIENYVDADVDETFRDSAIFSDADEVLLVRPKSNIIETSPIKTTKVAPPVPAKKRQDYVKISSASAYHQRKCKPNVAQKPDFLKTVFVEKTQDFNVKTLNEEIPRPSIIEDKEDVSVGQSQAGWVKKIVGQFQGQIET